VKAPRFLTDKDVMKLVTEARELLARHGAQETSIDVRYEDGKTSCVTISLNAMFYRKLVQREEE